MTQLSENANRYATAALRERRAEMSGELTRLEEQVRRLKASLVHLDATLRLMDPDRDPNEIPSKRPHIRTKLFGAGKLNRLILDAMRRGARPMTMGEVVDGIASELGYGDDAASGLRNRMRANLRYMEKGERVRKEGAGPAAVWRLGRQAGAANHKR